MNTRLCRPLILSVLAVLLSGCPERLGKVVIGGITVDASSIDEDRAKFKVASDTWCASSRVTEDTVKSEYINTIKSIGEKKYRIVERLVATIYDWEAFKSKTSEMRNSRYDIARSHWISSAMLGDEFSIETLCTHYMYFGEVRPVDAAVWSLVSAGVCTRYGLIERPTWVCKKAMEPLTELERDIARRRADALIAQILKNREEYDRLIGTDF
jgi:hypothetical protein